MIKTGHIWLIPDLFNKVVLTPISTSDLADKIAASLSGGEIYSHIISISMHIIYQTELEKWKN